MNDQNEWWRGAVIYQIYPRSYLDTNADGVGDLPGITAKLPYVASLGVDAVWLSPFFKSPMLDFGYDISDYRAVDPVFGTLDDFKRLTDEAHRLGLKIVIDQVLSHTSDQHPWFAESRRGRDNAKADWYVWVDPRPDGTPPNNWLSVFGGPAWQWDTGRMQYYLHNFLASQPDLNFHNPEVRAALLDVCRFWLDLGVDGFRLDTANFYVHDPLLRDNPPLPEGQSFATAPKTNPYAFQDHVYDKTRPENLAFLEDLRRLTDECPGRMMVGEMGVDGPAVGPTLAAYTERGKRLHMAYAFELLVDDFSTAYVREVIERLDREIGDGWICWSLGNHDVMRVVSRWGLERRADRAAPLLWAFLLTLRGSSCVYQGDELGLSEADIPFERIRDPYGVAMWPEFKGRDGCRTPMPWLAAAPNAGFCAAPAEPWLPLPADHAALAVDAQESVADSVLNRIRAFTAWRRHEPLFRDGDMAFLDAPDNVLCVVRSAGRRRLAAAFNFGTQETAFSLPAGFAPIAGHGFGGELRGGEALLPGLDAVFAIAESD